MYVYEQYLFEQCRGTTIQAVHRQERLGYKWLLVKNAVDLTTDEQAKLAAMFEVPSTLQWLHELKEAFRTIVETAAEPRSAAERPEGWIAEVEQSGLRHVTKFVTTLRRW